LYKRANVWLAALLFVISTKRYLDLAVNHNIAINLEADDLRKRFYEGSYVPETEEIKALALSSITVLRASLRKSFLSVLFTLCCALFIGFYFGRLNSVWPVDWVKVVEIATAFLLMWSTLFELGWGLRTWKGKALHELVHALLFRVIFVSGSLMLMLSLIL